MGDLAKNVDFARFDIDVSTRYISLLAATSVNSDRLLCCVRKRFYVPSMLGRLLDTFFFSEYQWTKYRGFSGVDVLCKLMFYLLTYNAAILDTVCERRRPNKRENCHNRPCYHDP